MFDIGPLKDEILRNVRSLRREQTAWRRHFHQYPEVSFAEFETTATLTAIAKKLGLKVVPIKLKTGLVAELKGGHPGPTVAIRSDIDALPLIEETGLRFKSRVAGRMHACGHDLHMAIVLGAAAVLARMRRHIRGNVRFIFQPGEECPPGGAGPMMQAGALRNVLMIMGLHVDPQLPTGMISLRDGVAMASVLDFDLIIQGRGGHAAAPHRSVDAIVTAAEVISSVQKIVSRELNPNWPVVISFGRIEGGAIRNVIADRVVLSGTARALSDEAAHAIPRLLRRTAQAVCRAHGAVAELSLVAGYPVLVNDPRTNRILERNFRVLYGTRKIKTTPQVLGGEDFARYLDKVPGAMFFLGVRNKKIGADQSWHSPRFIADEKAMLPGTALLAASAIDYLAGETP
jgi:amidohydrolase